MEGGQRQEPPSSGLVILPKWHCPCVCTMPKGKPGLYANINAKRKRGGKPRKPGSKGAPKASDFRAAAKTAKKK